MKSGICSSLQESLHAVSAAVTPYQIAYNLIPQIGGEQVDGYTSEEMKLHFEGRKIMHLPELNVSCTCVRVPVMRSHSISVCMHFDKHLSVEDVREVLKTAPGVKLVDDLNNKEYPMPLETSGQDIVYVGRIRPDITDDNGICLWCCGDPVQLTKWVSFIPSSLARAFMASTKAASLPAKCSAMAQAQSLAEDTAMDFIISSTVMLSPTFKNTWLPPFAAAASEVVTESPQLILPLSMASMMRSMVITFVTLAGASGS